MRRLWVGVLGLTLLAPLLRAGDQPKSDKTAAQPKTPAAQFRELAKAFRDQMADLGKQFDAAKTEEEKAKLREQALKGLPAEYGQKMLDLAAANAKDPAALDILIWVCTQLPECPQVPRAIETLLRDHAGNDRLASVCQSLVAREDGPELLRAIRTKARSKLVQLQAGLCLAAAFNEKDEPTAEQDREAEALLTEFLDASQKLDTIPHPMVKAAEGLLWEVRNLRAGKSAPDAEGADVNDKPVKLSQHKGKVVVLDFWATWCPPCRAMIPHEREMVQKYADKPFVLVSVSADEKKETLKGFLAKEPMPWVHWWCGGQGGVIEQWNIQSYPTVYVIDAKGVIRGKVTGGGPEQEKRLDELVVKLVQEAG